MPRGRKSEYTDAIAQGICERIAEGQSLRAICRDEDMPDRATVLRWLDAHDEFAAKYARAREVQADLLFEDMQEVADSGSPEDTQRARLRVMTMQWRASKLAPKKYGEKIQTEHSGSVTVRHEDMSDDELARIASGGGG